VGAGSGASGTAPNVWLLEQKRRAKEFSIRNGYYRFYLLDQLLPVESTPEAKALHAIIDTESRDAFNKFLEVYINGVYDPIDDGGKDLELLKRLLAISEEEAKARWVYEINTRSGKRIYVKVKDGKVVVFGDTFPVKEQLKALGLKWDPVERVWYTTAIDVNTLKTRLEGV
jgi:hypothetical protein